MFHTIFYDLNWFFMVDYPRSAFHVFPHTVCNWPGNKHRVGFPPEDPSKATKMWIQLIHFQIF